MEYGNYALKILMAGINVKNKEALKEGLKEIIGTSGSIEEDIITDKIIGNAPINLNSLEKLAAAIDNDEQFSFNIKKELDNKISNEELEEYIDENLLTLSTDEILEICK